MPVVMVWTRISCLIEKEKMLTVLALIVERTKSLILFVTLLSNAYIWRLLPVLPGAKSIWQAISSRLDTPKIQMSICPIPFGAIIMALLNRVFGVNMS